MNNRILPKINFRTARILIVGFLVLTSVFVSGYYLGSNGYKASVKNAGKVDITRDVPDQYSDLDFNLFWQVWDNIESDYLIKEDIDRRKMVYGAISGMVAAVGDPYTAFLPPEDNKIFQEDIGGTFEGVGIQIEIKNDKLTVINPLPNTPAIDAGIKAGDHIAGIVDEAKGVDRSTAGISLPEAVRIIRGPQGSKVKLVLMRENENEPIEVEVERRSIDVPSVVVTILEGESMPEEARDRKVAHVQLLKFGGETKEEWSDAVVEVLAEPNLDGVVLDLRNNPGGYLQAAVDIAGDYVDSGSVVVVEETSSGTKSEFKTSTLPRLANMPTVILVNGGSASASEILAGSLRDLKGTEVVGTKTFGKGTIQEPRQLEGGSSLHITTSKWLTPNKIWVHKEGLTPDLEVEDNTDTPEDEQLFSAINQLL